VLETFELMEFFEFVCGTPGKMAKSQQLKELLAQGTVDSNALMIGDRNVDLQAAHSNGLQSAGVLWGYGDLTELNAEQPAHVFESPGQLPEQLASTR
ncbi:MAG: HAD hydrolase-like protein, partial [Pseudomonadales bacterium]|nr:HAD hydrolase-like protein [Pseudomonadales bacterium]